MCSANLYSQEFLKEFISVKEFVKTENQSFFIANDGVFGEELWKTDGTKTGTTLVKDIYKGSENASINNLFYYNNKVYFSADDGVFGQELWVTDGTEQNTKLLKNIYTYVKQGSNPRGFTIFNDELYFFAADDNISGYQDIWKTDGTENGTVKVYSTNTNRGNLYVANKKLYFTQGSKLYKVDTNNSSLSEINIDNYYSISEFNVFNDEIYFISHTSNKSDIRLYKLDKDEQLTLLKEYNEPQYGDIEIDNFMSVNSNVYYSVRTDFNSSADTDVLWKTDGTATNTKEIKIFGWDRHLSDSGISNFTAYKNKLYFNGGSKNGFTMWVSDGTTVGTKNFLQKIISKSSKMIVQNNSLYYLSSFNLYQTDGFSNDILKNNELLISSKSYNDNFNIATGHNSIYLEGSVYNDSKNGLFTINPSPLIEVKQNTYRLIKDLETIDFISKVDSLSKKIITITNKGNRDLAIGSIKIEGNSFFVSNTSIDNISQENPNGFISQIIKPKKSTSFEIGFYPSEIKTNNARLLIKSNDAQYLNYNIILKGLVEEGKIQKPNINFPLDKEIVFNKSSLILENNTILENSPLNTSIGNFIVDDSFKYIFNLIDGEADNDNFRIENNILKSNKIFDYERKNTFLIKVKVTQENNIDSSIISCLVINIINENEDIEGECALSLANLSYGLNDIEIINDNIAIAVGESGKIIKSFDSGETWKNISINIPNELYGVQFLNTKVGYINGDKILLKTTNSGENWFKVNYPSESYPYVNKMTFITEEEGFLYGNDGKLYKTNNGGKTWDFMNLGFVTITDIEFFDDKNGVLSINNNRLLKTNNGGLSWEQITLNITELSNYVQFVKLNIVNNKVGYAITYDGKVIKTEDSGETWGFKNEIQIEYPTEFKFLDENTGYLLSGFNFASIHKTIDGGTTWSEINFERKGALTSLDFFDNNNAIIVGHGSGFGSTSENGHAIYKINPSNNLVEIKSSLNGNAYYTSMDFQGNFGLIVSDGQYSGNSDSRRTIDNGITWQEINLPEVQYEGYSDCFIKNNIFYILGNQFLYKSTDFGETFNKITNPGIKKVFWLNNNTVYGYSFDGFYISNDAGTNWTKSFNFESPNFMDIYFINSSKGFLLTYNGYYITEDGGENFTYKEFIKQNDQDYIFFRKIFFKDEMNGIIGNQDGLVYTTANGGETWERQVNKMRASVTQLGAIDNSFYAISTNGGGYTNLFKSLDNGKSWDAEINFGEDIKSIKEFKGSLYLLGDRGAFYKYEKSTSILTPSFIEGNMNLSKNTSSTYFVSQDDKINYKWSVTGNNTIKYYNNIAKIDWKESGDFTISVIPYNNCFEGVSKKINIKVYPETKPVINGLNEVKYFTNEKYFTNLNENSSYLWSVEGDENFVENDNEIDINWGEIGNGLITVVETNNLTGTRVKNNLQVKILKVLSIEESSLDSNILVYPIPAQDKIQIDFPSDLNILQDDIKIYDILGKEQSFYINDNSIFYVLDISNLKEGVYFLKIKIDSKIITKKIIKSN